MKDFSINHFAVSTSALIILFALVISLSPTTGTTSTLNSILYQMKVITNKKTF